MLNLYDMFFTRYRPIVAPDDESRPQQHWTTVNDVETTEYTIEDLSHGENYEIEVDTVAYRVSSRQPLEIRQTIVPQVKGFLTGIHFSS